MKTITYNNKQYKLPFDVELPEDPTAEVEVEWELWNETLERALKKAVQDLLDEDALNGLDGEDEGVVEGRRGRAHDFQSTICTTKRRPR